jgi:hypothetical protein
MKAQTTRKITSSEIMVTPLFQFIEESLEVKLPTIWTDEKQRRQREEKD